MLRTSTRAGRAPIPLATSATTGGARHVLAMLGVPGLEGLRANASLSAWKLTAVQGRRGLSFQPLSLMTAYKRLRVNPCVREKIVEAPPRLRA